MIKPIIIIASILGILLLVLMTLNLVTKLEMETEVIMDAPQEKVWQVLTDVHAYPDWNPFITSIEGEMKLGRSINYRNGKQWNRNFLYSYYYNF